jgi:hypothetical protein
MEEKPDGGDPAGQGMPPRPDILRPYAAEEDLSSEPRRDRLRHAIVCVRPESNRLPYEAEIVSVLKARARVTYIANLNGRLFTEGGILRSRYASQFRFARDPRAFLEQYPELALAFEEHFGVPVSEAPIRSSLGDLSEIGLSPEGLFATIVSDSDFLAVKGQTFKRIHGVYIVNYDLPAIVRRYTPEANVFVALAEAEADSDDFYDGLNEALHDTIASHSETPLVFGAELSGLSWHEQVRRTYHLSMNRLQAMLDMADFVYPDASGRLGVSGTPLGSALVKAGAIDPETLVQAKETQLCRLAAPGHDLANLAFLPQAGQGMGFEELCKLMGSIKQVASVAGLP